MSVDQNLRGRPPRAWWALPSCASCWLQGVAQSHIVTRTHAELDLTTKLAVQAFFAAEKPDQVYLAAAKVGGIHANNTYPADFIYENLMMQANVIDAAFKMAYKSCCFWAPAASTQAGSAAHARRRLAHRHPRAHQRALRHRQDCRHQAVRKLQPPVRASHGVDYRSVMPTNLYGPGDNYHPENSHVIPALIRRFHEAKVANRPPASPSGARAHPGASFCM
jgi:GDP-L-fucose synthase